VKQSSPEHVLQSEKKLRHIKRANPQKRLNPHRQATVNGLMSEHAFFEYRAKLISTAHTEDQGEPIHCLIKMEIGAGHERSRELLEQEAGDLVLFNVNPGPHRRITHSSIGEVDEKRLRELSPATDFNRWGARRFTFIPSDDARSHHEGERLAS
jgi:hypothetical protein